MRRYTPTLHLQDPLYWDCIALFCSRVNSKYLAYPLWLWLLLLAAAACYSARMMHHGLLPLSDVASTESPVTFWLMPKALSELLTVTVL